MLHARFAAFSPKSQPTKDTKERGGESKSSPQSHVIAEIGKGKNLPLINTDHTDRKSGDQFTAD
ncbi:hypothetical protein AYO50_02350 [Acidobacteria bacterium SCGC AG-212-P17]|nr:hypothetical protein AYO50_02350 [Acidobacteria bacterium SCGC AG-212-P17]